MAFNIKMINAHTCAILYTYYYHVDNFKFSFPRYFIDAKIKITCTRRINHGGNNESRNVVEQKGSLES